MFSLFCLHTKVRPIINSVVLKRNMTFTKTLCCKQPCRPHEVKDLIHLAYPIDKKEMQQVILQIFTHKALNQLLYSRGLPQHPTFWLASKSCFDAGLITQSAFNDCIRINQAGNAVKHQSVICIKEK